MMRISLFAGDITDAPADTICTSTNARLTLMMGTGGSVRERGGFEVLRACEELLAQSGRASFAVGSAHRTTAGRLPFKAVIHCVASDPVSHISSPEIVRACVRNALAHADAVGSTKLAMPVFATGHAHLRFDRAVEAIAAALRETQTNVAEVVLVTNDRERMARAADLLGRSA
ncbi:MAG TPA: macro domain-containing protein [Thermoanaerobaculia bacterium]|nr:macro domain-containing protein [Thermoanaerobaculia bacterium]